MGGALDYSETIESPEEQENRRKRKLKGVGYSYKETIRYKDDGSFDENILD